MLVPSDDIINSKDGKTITLHLKFMHPFEVSYMNMDKPKNFEVMQNGVKSSLTSQLTKQDIDGMTFWSAKYTLTRPGDYIFYAEPQPYFEPAEGKFIIQHTKVIVNALGLQNAWDSEIGLKSEIVPLTRPYGLFKGNVFQGQVKLDGRPVPFAEIEVEYYNENKAVSLEVEEPFITQLVKTDANGVFTYSMPRAGWWGFASVIDSDLTLEHEGKKYPVEIGAVIWIKSYEIK
ncbi:nickel transport complex transmembrane protein NikM [Candidatus Magnetoovum chiemensis]|nr:nickel transport complex transmembrane protein NikM [Candidatus Magnetoovum chiemensis]